jgi:hypothetical protein
MLKSLRTTYYKAVLIIDREDMWIVFEEEKDPILSDLRLQSPDSLLFIGRGREVNIF